MHQLIVSNCPWINVRVYPHNSWCLDRFLIRVDRLAGSGDHFPEPGLAGHLKAQSTGPGTATRLPCRDPQWMKTSKFVKHEPWYHRYKPQKSPAFTKLFFLDSSHTSNFVFYPHPRHSNGLFHGSIIPSKILSVFLVPQEFHPPTKWLKFKIL